MNSELAILALAKTGDKRAVKPLIANLENTNVKIVEATIKALSILKDAKVVEPLRLKLNIHEPMVRKAAAEALSELGETQWQSCVKGEERDIVRLAKKGLPGAIKVLIERLKSPSWGERKAAAEVLIKIASEPPDGFRNFWNEIQTLINEPHTDSHYDEYRSTDCSYNEHTDRGIGLSAPKFLKGK
jgi:HEAT repeat protein